MLRWLLALVVVANLLFLAWSQQWLAPLGLGPLPHGEPERLQQQVRPEALVLRADKPNGTAPEPEVAASAAEDAASAAEAAASAASQAASAASAPSSHPAD